MASQPFRKTGRHWIPITVLTLGVIGAVAVAFSDFGDDPSPPTGVQGAAAEPTQIDTSGQLTGSMDDWMQAVCGYVTANPPGVWPSATRSGQCVPFRGVGAGVLLFGAYPVDSESLISAYLAKMGPYAEGSTGTEHVVFATPPSGNRSMLAPLEKFGFVVHEGNFSACSSDGVLVECGSRPAPPTPGVGGAAGQGLASIFRE
jgi:hypothetical protein